MLLVKLLGVDEVSVKVALRDPLSSNSSACALAGTDTVRLLSAIPQNNKTVYALGPC